MFNWLPIKKLSQKTKKILGIALLTIIPFYWLLSLALVIPGIGVQSLQFISTVKKQVVKITPKDKFVFDPKHPFFDPILNISIRASYLANAMSTINFNNIDEINDHQEFYKKFTNDWFDKTWGDKIKNKEPIDLYDVGLDMIEFDRKRVSQTKNAYGFVSSGIQWMFHKNGMKEIFAKKMWDTTLKNQTIIDQELYDSKMKSSLGISGLQIESSVGTMVLNNKVWFLNQQIESIKYLLNLPIKPFIDKTLNPTTLDDLEITGEELFIPNLNSGLQLVQAGSIMFIIALIIIIPGIMVGVLVILEYKKEKKGK